MVDFTILWTNYHRLKIFKNTPSNSQPWRGGFTAKFLPRRCWVPLQSATPHLEKHVAQRKHQIQRPNHPKSWYKIRWSWWWSRTSSEICWSSAGYQFVIDFLSPPWLESWGSDGLFLWCPHSKSTVLHAENRCFNKTQNISKSSFKKWLWFKTTYPSQVSRNAYDSKPCHRVNGTHPS